MDISVIIPTRNRAALLGRCLAALCDQTLAPDRFEICVVDMGSTDQTPKVVELVKNHYPNHTLSLVHEPIANLSEARNRGLRATQTALAAIISDDIIAPPPWLSKLLPLFDAQDQVTAKIGGNITPLWAAPRPAWLTDSMMPLLGVTTIATARAAVATIPEGNSCYRRAALQDAGFFPPTPGRKSNDLITVEQVVDFTLRAKACKLFADPALTVARILPAECLTPLYLRRRAFWQGVSDHAASVYLKKQNIDFMNTEPVDLPLDRDDWAFINDGSTPPTDETLHRLRSLGFTLAASGFVPV